MKIRCDICNGIKKVIGLGMVEGNCYKCGGLGEIEPQKKEEEKFKCPEIKLYQEGIKDSGINNDSKKIKEKNK